jgi:hypothetical protein
MATASLKVSQASAQSVLARAGPVSPCCHLCACGSTGSCFRSGDPWRCVTGRGGCGQWGQAWAAIGRRPGGGRRPDEAATKTDSAPAPSSKATVQAAAPAHVRATAGFTDGPGDARTRPSRAISSERGLGGLGKGSLVRGCPCRWAPTRTRGSLQSSCGRQPHPVVQRRRDLPCCSAKRTGN